MARAAGRGNQHVLHGPGHNHSIGNLIRSHAFVELSCVAAANHGPSVLGPMAVVAVVTTGDGIPMQSRSGIVRGILGVVLGVDMQPNHATGFSNINLSGNVASL